MSDGGLFGELFDMSFRSFVTIRIVKVLYVLAIVGAAIGGIFILVSGLASMDRSGPLGLLVVIAAPVAFFVYVLLARVWLEMIIVIFRIAENTAELVEQAKSDRAGS